MEQCAAEDERDDCAEISTNWSALAVEVWEEEGVVSSMEGRSRKSMRGANEEEDEDEEGEARGDSHRTSGTTRQASKSDRRRTDATDMPTATDSSNKICQVVVELLLLFITARYFSPDHTSPRPAIALLAKL